MLRAGKSPEEKTGLPETNMGRVVQLPKSKILVQSQEFPYS